MSDARFQNLATRPHLVDTQELINALQKPGVTDDEIVTAIVVAVANLESLIRVGDDSPFINMGDLGATPITSGVTQVMENSGHTGADQGVYALAAILRLGALLGGFKQLEDLVNDIGTRVEKLEKG
ncbi:hypothetical protein R3Q06_02880 [Rhodococcus erythropolis]|uniref:hypothetical protein n=1 Tax=Rhodococcus erythropolis TaxID=1833 RepID=UPI00294A8985|nr:hypothetical protein [Rhodococcus erythropolis]MDV6272437.1 hypothetical protein [Rhodococcus erythropolis]